jgi:hypothetical protein
MMREEGLEVEIRNLEGGEAIMRALEAREVVAR